jgi:hypothetical protein
MPHQFAGIKAQLTQQLFSLFPPQRANNDINRGCKEEERRWRANVCGQVACLIEAPAYSPTDQNPHTSREKVLNKREGTNFMRFVTFGRKISQAFVCGFGFPLLAWPRCFLLRFGLFAVFFRCLSNFWDVFWCYVTFLWSF